VSNKQKAKYKKIKSKEQRVEIIEQNVVGSKQLAAKNIYLHSAYCILLSAYL
jgi:hypothetical protein